MTIQLSTWELELIEQGRTCEHCGKPTDHGCARCLRTLCTMHGPVRLSTMTHITGLPCDEQAPRGVPELCGTCGHVPVAHWRNECVACLDMACQAQETTDQWGRLKIELTENPQLDTRTHE